jgi:hypothetical protein
MFLTHALRAIFRAAVVTGDSLWKYVTLLLSGTPPAVTFISDASTNNLVITPVGDTRPSNFNPYTPGYYSNYFDGTGDYLSLPSNAAFALSSDFTIEFWLYQTATTGEGTVVYNSTSGGINLFTNITSNWGIARSGIAVDNNFGTPPAFNTWNYIAVSRTGSTLKAFINGVQVFSGTNSVSYVAGPLQIGYSGFGTITGYISNLRFVKGTALYTANFTPSTTPLTAISGTSLLTCQSNRLIDNSLNNFTITKNGDTTVSGFIPFVAPTTANVNTLYSTYFDGTGDYLSLPVNAATQLGSNNFTIELWLYLPTLPGIRNNLFYWNGNSSGYNAIGLVVTPANKIGINFSESGSSWKTEDVITGVGSTLTAQTWQHIAVVRNGQNIQIYLDGVAQGAAFTTTAAGTSLMTTYTMNHIGAYGTSSHYLNGYVSNLRIVNGTAVYTTNFTRPIDQLTAIANTSLLTCQDATLKDNSTNAFAITSAGDARPIAQSPFTQVTTALDTTYLGSGYFDGTGDYLSVPANTALALGTGNFTLEAWVYATTAFTTNPFFESRSSAASATGYALLVNSGNVKLYTNSGFAGTSTATLAINSWNHVALVRSGTGANQTTFYINGVASGSFTFAGNLTDATTNETKIGASTSGGELWFGYISNARIVKGTAFYTANFAPPAVPLTAVTNTQLLTLQTDQPAANKQFIDNSGSNLPITQFGNATQGSLSPYGANWSNFFDGSGDYLSIADNAAFVVGSGNFTIEAWIFPTQVAAAESPIFKLHSADSIIELRQNTNKLDCFLAEISTSVTTSTGTIAIVSNTWNHVAFVRNGTTTYTFVNGVLDQTKTAQTQNLTTLATTKRIAANQLTNAFFTGHISNFRFVKGTALYTANFTPPTTPLTAIANTSLLTCQSPSLIDNGPNAFAITKAGDVSVQKFSPFGNVTQTPQSYSGFFDGTGDYLTSPTGNATLNTALDILGGDYTVEFWMYKTADTNATILTNFTASGANGWQINARETGGVQVDHWVNNSSTGRASTFSNYTINTWVHIAVVKLSGNYYFYVNGTEVGIFQGGTRAAPANGGAGTGLGIGTYIQNLSYPSPFTGYLSNLRVVKGTAVYTANFTPSTTPLTAISGTSLLVCRSATFIDNSANAFPLTSFGDVKPRQFNPFGYTNTTGQSYTPALFGGSAYFDGTGDYLATPATGQFVATGDFTIQFSFYLTSLAATNHLIGNYTAAVATDWIIEVINTGVMQVFLDGSTQRLGHSGITTGQWYHVSITRSGTTVTGRVNGVAMNTTPTYTMSGTFGTATKAIYMGMRGGSTNPLFGYLSDVSLINGTASYKSNFVPPLAPLTAIAGTTLLLNMDKGGVADSSRSVDLETVADAKIRDETPYAGSYYSNYFDGVSSRLNLQSLAANPGTSNFTIEFWANVPVAPSAGAYFTAFYYALGTAGLRCYIADVTGTKLVIDVGSTTVVTVASTAMIGQWAHIAISRSGTSMTTYINGALVATVTDSSNIIGNTFYIGGYTGNYYAGYISNFRLVIGSALYTAAFTPPTAPLTAITNTSLLTCQSKSFVDNSSNAFAVSRNGSTAVRAFNPFQKNTYSSMFFDGTGDYLSVPTTPALGFGTGDYTIEFYMYLTASPASSSKYTLLDFRTAANAQAHTCYVLNSAGTLYLGFYNGSADTTSSSQPVTLNNWVHCVWTRSSGVLKIFVNGVQAYSASMTADYTSTRPLTIGAPPGGGSEFLFGYIADLRITKAARYTANFTPPTAPLPTA